jgi:hypothetical protein
MFDQTGKVAREDGARGGFRFVLEKRARRKDLDVTFLGDFALTLHRGGLDRNAA